MLVLRRASPWAVNQGTCNTRRGAHVTYRKDVDNDPTVARWNLVCSSRRKPNLEPINCTVIEAGRFLHYANNIVASDSATIRSLVSAIRRANLSYLVLYCCKLGNRKYERRRRCFRHRGRQYTSTVGRRRYSCRIKSPVFSDFDCAWRWRLLHTTHVLVWNDYTVITLHTCETSSSRKRVVTTMNCDWIWIRLRCHTTVVSWQPHIDSIVNCIVLRECSCCSRTLVSCCNSFSARFEASQPRYRREVNVLSRYYQIWASGKRDDSIDGWFVFASWKASEVWHSTPYLIQQNNRLSFAGRQENSNACRITIIKNETRDIEEIRKVNRSS